MLRCGKRWNGFLRCGVAIGGGREPNLDWMSKEARVDEKRAIDVRIDD